MARVRTRSPYATEALAEALGRPVSDQEGLTGHTVVAHWPGLGHVAFDDEQRVWTSKDWEDHLDAPSWEHPRAKGLRKERFSIWHAEVRLAPGDRRLTGPEWSEIAHRLARAAGIATPGDTSSCRWIALQAQPRRLDLIANLIRPDGTWTVQAGLLLQMAAECRRLETALSLLAPLPGRSSRRTVTPPAAVRAAVGTTGQLGELLHQLADETTGPLATARGLVEHAAHRLGALPHPDGLVTEHQLEWIARRLYGIQQDLDSVAADLAAPFRPPVPAPAASVPRSASARTRSTP
ncbi:hypothetical protein [Streptomyces sp. T028]|uniref:hypothetical protein n=1 Tax=Streptomyces sp. T028 TaxID=3394379 RepID=UPI003A8479CF